MFTRSDNRVSNETFFVHTVRMLRSAGGAYIGVGPEQNFTYIAKLHPDIAFIIDIRRENRNLHLMYKALFELSSDRADFLSRLFSRERPPGIGANTSVEGLFAKYAAVQRADKLHDANRRLIRAHLIDDHQFPLTSDDLEWIEYAFDAFFSEGPDIHYGRSRQGSEPGPSYRDLMTAVDVGGHARSYLATEQAFAFVKTLHRRNLIVPVVGDFAGPAALRLAGSYIREHGNTVRAFYGSNVEVYLNRQQSAAFCNNLAALPYDSRTLFISSKGLRPFATKLKPCFALQ